MAERETIVRWDLEERIVHIWTADLGQLKKLLKLGYKSKQDSGGWWLEGPMGCVRFKRLVDGRIVKRPSKAGQFGRK